MFDLKKIISANQTRKTDNHTIKKECISSLELMERASLSFVNAIEKNIYNYQKIAVVCGIGNNGGDGFAITRILQSKGYLAKAILIKTAKNLSNNCKTNFNKLAEVTIIETKDDLLDFKKFDIIIDALFGSGLTRKIEGLAAKVIKNMNAAKKHVLSVDIPSGLYCDKLPDSDFIVKSDITISFQRPKLSFFYLESNQYIKDWKVINIGLDEDFIQKLPTNNFILDRTISESLKIREKHAHKGTFGHSLIIAGSYGKIGAAVLASRACLKSGAGLLTTYIPNCGYDILQISTPEAMCLTDKKKTYISKLPDISSYNSIGIGPGIGKKALTKIVLKQLFESTKVPLVIDADALNIISENRELINKLPKNSILTPHPKEFERLVGKWKTTIECFEKQKQFAKEHKCIVVLKGANTCICNPEEILFFNTTGNPGMATGGSGDVLTGIITGLLAQGYTPIKAALIGVYFHGKAGDNATKQNGENSLIASDIINYLKIETE
ncbi:bifunctional ADP-dependent NAD(P)H-hydrate dehydratase/NAD(P)H-hydrate epimerase [Polaribacter sp. Hel1_85]|uniref:bifunctional ADP-dependent NAD(P)H-hydrate dehydratase/NAD(P)H-hydrate epimerase n=1 Tax=Polaribacter sp. Hel1_85 TaxID=1250005 RepID=UPI00052E35C3|nr:bifunctional ADP-dependent NAD(P)H-hydrate dehydratase/NAD(P)H-hydrate epimerase [Polaribacter sp. Hel1_85]KGL63742.1 NAD(P)HX epimerase / NAD(P)HX dehydratase [Polaribacter sp. Hel1_85]